MLHNIQRLCQLHEHLQVLYLVDCYEAQLLVGDGDYQGVKARGSSVLVALLTLDDLLDNYVDVRDYRRKMFNEK